MIFLIMILIFVQIERLKKVISSGANSAKTNWAQVPSIICHCLSQLHAFNLDILISSMHAGRHEADYDGGPTHAKEWWRKEH